MDIYSAIIYKTKQVVCACMCTQEMVTWLWRYLRNSKVIPESI